MPLPPSARERVTEAGVVFETLHAGKSALHYHEHAHSFVTIVLRGSYTEVCDGIPQSCLAGTLVVHDAGEEHADYFEDDAVCLNVELPDEVMRSLRGQSLLSMDAALRSATHDVVRSFYGSRERCVQNLSGAVETLQRALQTPPPGERRLPDWLQTTMERFSWTEAVPMRDAAGIAGIHYTHFSRAFRHHVGMTPNEYRRRARIRLASELLLGSGASLSRIAQHCGFADQSHFTRDFGESVGVSPSNYRRIFAR